MSKFSKRQRIKNQTEFGAVLQEGKKFVCSSFVVLAIETANNYPRLGIVVSKKIGNAVIRNRVKRSFREIFRQLSCQDKLSQRDFVIIARRTASRASFEELHLAVLKSFQWFERKLA
jgi:ribonuclease P protein component